MAHASPASVLKVLRDAGEQRLDALAALIDRPIWPTPTIIFGDTFVGPCVTSLALAGLVELYITSDDPVGRQRLPVEALDATAPSQVIVVIDGRWPQVQMALGISLRDLDRMQQGSIVVSPIFTSTPTRRFSSLVAAAHGDPFDVFVVMPFVEEMNSVFDTIRSVALACELSVARADDLFSSGVILEQVWSAICSAQLVVADCTHRNPNVFYEIGLADVVGTPMLLLTQDIHDVPFDIQHRRLIRYATSDEGIRRLKIALEGGIRSELSATKGRHHTSRTLDPR